MAGDARRVDIGFSGGQMLALRMKDAPYEELRKALNESGTWITITTEDSDVSVDLREVVYVRVDTEQHKVGF
jgi:hypothetical protein